MISQRDVERFLSRFVRASDTDGCWEWGGITTPSGQPLAQYGRTTMPARRMSMFVHGHAIAADQVVTSNDKCENKLCVNPAHLKIMSKQQFHRETYDRRAAAGKLPRRKLSPAVIAEIRASPPELTEQQLAERYGVTHSRIYQLRHSRGGAYRGKHGDPADRRVRRFLRRQCPEAWTCPDERDLPDGRRGKKLSAEIVEQIRSSPLSTRELARKFKLRYDRIWRIQRGITHGPGLKLTDAQVEAARIEVLRKFLEKQQGAGTLGPVATSPADESS